MTDTSPDRDLQKSDLPTAVEVFDGGAAPALSKNTQRPLSDAPSSNSGHPDRIVDPTRQGGSNAGPKQGTAGAAPLSVDEALAYRNSILWRQLMGRSDQAVIALATEVDRLREELARLATKAAIQRLDLEAAKDRRREMDDEINRLREVVVMRESACDRLVELLKQADAAYADLKANMEKLRLVGLECADMLTERNQRIAEFNAVLPEIIGCARGDERTCTRDEYGWYPCCRARLAAAKHGLIPAPERVK